MRRWTRGGALLAAASAAVLIAGCGSSGGSASGSSGGGGGRARPGLTPPQAGTAVPASVGKTEGHLNLIAWEGYAQPQWVKPFQQATGCQVSVKYAGSSSEMVSLMANGGGGQYDLVSASGDADLRLIYGGDVKPDQHQPDPVLEGLPPLPAVAAVQHHRRQALRRLLRVRPERAALLQEDVPDRPHLLGGAVRQEVLGPDHRAGQPDPDRGRRAVPVQDASPSLGITDPYELTQTQFNAAVSLLKKEHPLIKKYWDLASQEISLFQSGTTVVGAAWPYQTNTLVAAGAKVADTIPSQGATGWADTWMLATKAPDPNCAYKWMQWVTTPKVQAEEAVYFGETPANKLACPIMNSIQKGSCAAYHANAPESYFQTIKFWKTPLAQCGNGKNDCVPFQQWVTAWTQITG